MKVVLLKDTRIQHKAGDIVEVSPVVFDFLVTTNSAKPLEAEKAAPKRKRKEQ